MLSENHPSTMKIKENPKKMLNFTFSLDIRDDVEKEINLLNI